MYQYRQRLHSANKLDQSVWQQELPVVGKQYPKESWHILKTYAEPFHALQHYRQYVDPKVKALYLKRSSKQGGRRNIYKRHTIKQLKVCR